MSSRDRLLRAAAELLQESADHDVSTRAICERAGVQAPTLYHHFGNKQGLLAAMVVDAFTTHLRDAAGQEDQDDPVAAVRFAWDEHVRFGLAHPSYYTYAFGELRPNQPGGLPAVAEQALLDPLNRVARQGRLRVAPEVAARQLLAATIGTTLTRIAQPDLDTDQLRDTVLAAVLEGAPAPPATTGGLPALAVAFLAALDQEGGELTAGEATLLREWLHRLAAPG